MLAASRASRGSQGCDGGSGVTGMWSPNPSEKKRFGYLGYSRVLEGTFCAIVTYAKSCHVSRELSPSTAKGSREMECECPNGV